MCPTWIIQDVCGKEDVAALSTGITPWHLLGAHTRPLQVQENHGVLPIAVPAHAAGVCTVSHT